MRTFEHVVKFDREGGTVRIFRRFEGGGQHLYAEYRVVGEDGAPKVDFEEFCRMLGEGLATDSPAARSMFGLED